MYGNGRMMIPNCLDALSRFCLLPWAVILLRQSLGRISNRGLCSHYTSLHLLRTLHYTITHILIIHTHVDDSSWGIVMCAYGALVSMLNAGRVVGRWYRNRDRMSLSYIAVLGMSFVLLTLTTRYSCLLLVFYIIGFCSSRICSNDIDDCSRSGVNKSICNSVYNSVGNETCYNQADIDYANAIKVKCTYRCMVISECVITNKFYCYIYTHLRACIHADKHSAVYSKYPTFRRAV